MSPSPTVILLTPPSQLSAAQVHPVSLGVMGFRLGTGGRLLQTKSAVSPPKGSYLVIDDKGFDGTAPADAAGFVRQVLWMCANLHCAGVIGNWESPPTPSLQTITTQLDRELDGHKLRFFVTERWGKCSLHSQVLLSSALSGGSLAGRIAQGQETFGNDRVALAIERSAEEFLLPAPSGSGIPLTPEELRRRMDQFRPATYFSGELCAHYFTWQGQDGRAHFVLFDNETSLRKKLQVARQAGVSFCLMAYPEVADVLPGLLRP
jgi:hypothetical protein